MNILRSLVVATTAWSLTASTFAAGDLWVSDFEKAKATAAKEGKDLLIDFTSAFAIASLFDIARFVFL